MEQGDPCDPPWNPNNPNNPNQGLGSTEHPAPKKKKQKPYAWVVSADRAFLNVLLNFCEYREQHISRGTGAVAPKITSDIHAREQLLRQDMDYRTIRLPRCKSLYKQATFASNVRKGLRWHGWENVPYYDYFGLGRLPIATYGLSSGAGSSSTAPPARVTSSGAGSSSTAPPARVIIDLEAGSNTVATATAVQTGTAIPPKPTLPPFPVGPTKQVGNLFPIKHPFTEVEMQSFLARNPGLSIATVLKIIYASSTSVDQGTSMYKAMGVVCAMISPTQHLLQKHLWILRVAKDLHYQGICDGGCSGSLGCAKDVFGYGVCRGFFPKADDIHGCRRVLSIAFTKKVKVFATLDDGPAPPNEVSLDEYNKYYAARNKFRDLQKAYDTAYTLRQAWEEEYGKRAAAIIPEAPDADDEELHMLSDEDLAKLGLGKDARKRAAKAAMVCIDCDDPATCGCAERALAPPKKVKAEPPVV